MPTTHKIEVTAPPLEIGTTELIALAKANGQHGFLTELDVRWVSETFEWELLEDLIWIGTKGDVIIVPGRSSSGHGFRTDFASTPRWLYPIFPPTGAWTKAAVVHDFLCRGLNDWWEAEKSWRQVTVAGYRPPPPLFDSVDTDAVFKLIMLEEGTSEIGAQIGWVGVRLGALANPARRDGWLRTLPEFAITMTIYLIILSILVAIVVML